MKKTYILIVALLVLVLESEAQFAIGIQTISVGKQMKADVPGTLRKLHEWGIKELEGGLPEGMDAAAFLKLLKENDLTLVATGSDFKELETDPQKVADRAKALGAKQVICYWIPHTGDDFTIDDAKKGVAVFNSAGEVLKKNGLALAYHAHGYEFRPYENGTLFDYLAKNFNPKFANFQMDVFWVNQSGTNPVALLNKYPDRFISMHLKDRLKGTPNSNNGKADVESNVVLGTGDVGIEAIVKAGRKAGIKHFFIEDEGSRQWEQVPQSVAYLKTIKF
ncbi:MAG TPA: sugar phosphate isomerase/epimerase [Cyclobacteriaceae bacterium]|nr:sugar phosphate isomerase/epimerase [Cyclobacteriaceae bacterium]